MEDESKINWKERYFKLLERVEALEAEIKELREKLNTNSNNSSKPPSQDPFRKSRTKQSSGKKPGGQPGHPGHARKLYPPEQITKTVNLQPDNCPHCGSADFNEAPISIECRQTVELYPT